MLCRKLVSEGAAVLDLWIYHAGDGEGGVEGSVTQLSCTSGMQISGEYIKAWKQKGWGGVGWGRLGAGSRRRCAVGMSALRGWRVIKEGALTEKGKNEGDSEKKLFYSSHLQLWTHYSCSVQVFWNFTFQTIRWSLPVSIQNKSLITITKGERERWDDKDNGVRAYVVCWAATRHRGRWAAQLLKAPLFTTFFFFLPCNIHIWLSPVDFGKVKSQHCFGLVGESGAGSADHTVSPLQQRYFFFNLLKQI